MKDERMNDLKLGTMCNITYFTKDCDSIQEHFSLLNTVSRRVICFKSCVLIHLEGSNTRL